MIRPERPEMSWRAKFYVYILAMRHLMVGSLLLVSPGLFSSPSFDGVRQIMPLERWAQIFLAIGIAGFASAIAGREWFSRSAIIVSLMVTASWAIIFIYTAFIGKLAFPTAPVIWSALVAKDLIVSAMPMRTPFEDLLLKTK